MALCFADAPSYSPLPSFTLDRDGGDRPDAPLRDPFPSLARGRPSHLFFSLPRSFTPTSLRDLTSRQPRFEAARIPSRISSSSPPFFRSLRIYASDFFPFFFLRRSRLLVGDSLLIVEHWLLLLTASLIPRVSKASF